MCRRPGRDGDALRLLGDLGVLVSGDRHTLVTDEPGTVAALARLAHRTREDGRLADVAAHVGWWANRADFPGTSAVVNLVAACQTRWVTGAAPEAERSVHTWRMWLGLAGTDDSTAGLFALLDRVSEGRVLPMLGEVATDDDVHVQRGVQGARGRLGLAYAGLDQPSGLGPAGAVRHRRHLGGGDAR